MVIVVADVDISIGVATGVRSCGESLVFILFEGISTIASCIESET